MKILLSALFVFFFFLYSGAQTKLAVKGGFNYSTARVYTNGQKQSTGFVPGGSFAIQLKTMFEAPLHFSPYIGYHSRGFIIKAGNNSGDQTRNFIHYIDVAPVLSLDFNISQNSSFIISAGPLASIAISGKEKRRIAGITTSQKMKFSTDGDYSLFDAGLHTSIGLQYKKLLVEIAYQYGLASINNNEGIDKRNIRNRTLSLNIGYYFKTYK